MTNYGAKIINNASAGLSVQQAIIANLSSNIANVNTPGYSRRTVEIETRAAAVSGIGIQVGDGVKIGSLQRVADAFLERTLQMAAGTKAATQQEDQYLESIQGLFNLTGTSPTIGTTLTAFYSAIDDLGVNPSSIELRANVIQRGQDLISSLQTTYNKVANYQSEIDNRLKTEVSTVNSITSQVAELNAQIKQQEASGGLGSAADQRDKRENLLQKLSEKLTFSQTELSDGTVNVSLSSGLTLVAGTNSRPLELTNSPSFAAGSLPPSLNGEVLGSIVFNFGDSSSPSHIDLTETLMAGQGSIGGMLRIRGYNDPANTSAFEATGILPELGARIEGITRALLTTFNSTYLGADRNTATPIHEATSLDLDGTPPPVFGFFDFNFSGVKDRGTPDGLPTNSDLDDLMATGGINNFTSLLRLTSTNPRDIAAALDSSGTATGAFVYSQGDGRNLSALSAISTSALTISAGNYSTVSTLNEAYNQTVGYVGNLRSAAKTANNVAEDSYTSAQMARDSFSGVSLDEEFTSLITFQRAYEASARMIKVATELFDQILSLI